MVIPLFSLQIVVFEGDIDVLFEILLVLIVKGNCIVSYCISLFHGEPPAFGLPALFLVSRSRDCLFEVSFGHCAHVCELETWVVAILSLQVSLCSVVDIGEAALVVPGFTHVHVNRS